MIKRLTSALILALAAVTVQGAAKRVSAVTETNAAKPTDFILITSRSPGTAGSTNSRNLTLSNLWQSIPSISLCRTGGNARGVRSLDLQHNRTAASQVAAGADSFMDPSCIRSTIYSWVTGGAMIGAVDSYITNSGAMILAGGNNTNGGQYSAMMAANSSSIATIDGLGARGVIVSGTRNRFTETGTSGGDSVLFAGSDHAMIDANDSAILGGIHCTIGGSVECGMLAAAQAVITNCTASAMAGGGQNLIAETQNGFIGGGTLNHLTNANRGFIFGNSNRVAAANAGAMGQKLTNTTASTLDVGINNTTKTTFDSGGTHVRGTLRATSGLRVAGAANFTNDVQIDGAAVVTGSLTVNGADSFFQGATVNNDLIVGGVIQTLGVASLDAGANITGDLAVSGTYSSTLTLGAGFVRHTREVAEADNVELTDDVIKCVSLAPFTLTLPTLAAAGDGRQFTFVDTAGNCGTDNVTIDGNGSETINGIATFALNQNFESVTIMADTSSGQWVILANYP